MWKYRQPEFALHLLCQLQKQQQCSLHCDTLLQTEGISIPAHSCVLSALSPVFGRVFAHSPSLQIGQSRLLKLKAVRARALLKLVGFMYSGEVQAESFDEQQEVIDVAYKLGFSNLLNGKKMQVKRQPEKRIHWKEIGLQTDETYAGKKDIIVQNLSEKVRFSHSATQTAHPGAPYAEACHVSENDLSVALTDVLSEYNSYFPTVGPDCIDAAAVSSSNIRTAFVRGQQIHRDKKRAKVPQKQTGTHISLKIKLKRKMRGASWEIVSVQEETGADGTRLCGASISERRTVDSGLKHGHAEHNPLQDGSVLAKTCRNTTEVQLSPPPMLTCQNLGTVTLTPPSDLTTSSPARRHSGRSCHHTPHPLSPGLPQPEESDEHIARLLEDIVMMGLNLMPSVPMDGRISNIPHLSQVCSHPDLKADSCEDAAALPTRCFCVHDHDREARGCIIANTSNSSGQSLTGSECPAFESQSTYGSVVEAPTSFAVSPLCSAPERHTEYSSCADQERVLPSSLPCGLELLPQSELEVMSVMGNLFWSANSVVPARAPIGSCNENVQILRTPSRNVGQNDVSTVTNPKSDLSSPAGTQGPDDLSKFRLLKHQVSLQQSANVQSPHSSFVINFSEMRIPKCLSPLALEESETFPQLPLDTSYAFQVDRKHQSFNSPEQQCLPDYPSPLSTPLNVDNLQSSEVGLGPGCSRSNKNNIKEPSGCNMEQEKNKGQKYEKQLSEGTDDRILDSWKTRPNKFMVNESDKRKDKMIGYINSFNVQPSSINTKVALGTGNTQLISSPKINCLKAKTDEKLSTSQSPLENLENSQANQAMECTFQDPCREETLSNQSDFNVKKLERERPSQKRIYAEDLEQNVSGVKKRNKSCAGFTASTTFACHDSLLRQRPVQNEDNDLVMDTQAHNLETNTHCPSKGKPLGLEHTLKNLEKSSMGLQMSTKTAHLDLQKTKGKEKRGCKENKAQENRNTSLDCDKTAVPALILNPEKIKQPNTLARLATRPGLCSKIFHKTSYSGGTTVNESFRSQQLRSSLQKTGIFQRTKSTFPKSRTPQSGECTVKMFRRLHNHLSCRKSMKDIKEKELKDVAVENGPLRRVQRDELDLKYRTDREQGNESLMDGKSTESDGSQTYTDLLAPDLNNNLEMETSAHRESSKTTDFSNKTISETSSKTLSATEGKAGTSDMTTDLFCTATANTEIVHSESRSILNIMKVVEVSASSEAEISDAEVDVLGDRSRVTMPDEDAASDEWLVGETEVEESQSCFGMDNKGVSACEKELRKQQIVGAKLPTSADTFWCSDLSISTEFSFVSKSAKNCDDEEEDEVIVDDVFDSFDVLPCSLSSQIISVQTIVENDLDEDEEVDVTGL